MRVRILQAIAGENWVWQAGEIHEMDDAVAKRYIVDRAVERVEEEKPKLKQLLDAVTEDNKHGEVPRKRGRPRRS